MYCVFFALSLSLALFLFAAHFFLCRVYLLSVSFFLNITFIHLSILQQDLSLCDSHIFFQKVTFETPMYSIFPSQYWFVILTLVLLLLFTYFGIFIQKSNKIPSRKKLELRAPESNSVFGKREKENESRRYKKKRKIENKIRKWDRRKKAMWQKCVRWMAWEKAIRRMNTIDFSSTKNFVWRLDELLDIRKRNVRSSFKTIHLNLCTCLQFQNDSFSFFYCIKAFI